MARFHREDVARGAPPTDDLQGMVGVRERQAGHGDCLEAADLVTAVRGSPTAVQQRRLLPRQVLHLRVQTRVVALQRGDVVRLVLLDRNFAWHFGRSGAAARRRSPPRRLGAAVVWPSRSTGWFRCRRTQGDGGQVPQAGRQAGRRGLRRLRWSRPATRSPTLTPRMAAACAIAVLVNRSPAAGSWPDTTGRPCTPELPRSAPSASPSTGSTTPTSNRRPNGLLSSLIAVPSFLSP